jgi:hypothetical protein
MVSFRDLIYLITVHTVFALPRLSREALQLSTNDSIQIFQGAGDLRLPLPTGILPDSASSAASYITEGQFRLIDIVQDSSVLRRNIPRKLLPSIGNLPCEDDKAIAHDTVLMQSGYDSHGKSEYCFNSNIEDSKRMGRLSRKRADGPKQVDLYDNMDSTKDRIIQEQTGEIPTSQPLIGTIPSLYIPTGKFLTMHKVFLNRQFLKW